MARPARALERHPLGDKARARPFPGKSPAKPGKSMVKFSVGRRARRSTIKLLARCNHFIVDKEPQHEELPPRCCADRSCCYRLWQEGRSQAGCCSCSCSCRCRSCRCSCGCRACRCSCGCSGRGCCEARRCRQTRRRRHGQGQGSCRRCCARRCRCSQRCNEEVIAALASAKSRLAPAFFVLRLVDRLARRSHDLPPAESILLIGNPYPVFAAAQG